MEYDFWKAKWDAGRIGFHQSKINDKLQQFFDSALEHCHRILVPLSGKSADTLWLLEQSEAEVVANEFVEQAVRDFHKEAERPYDVREEGQFRVYQSDRLHTYIGDFFELPSAFGPGHFDGLYDRAALIALDAPRRQRYVDCIKQLLAPGATGLLIAMYYDQERAAGPPYSVPREEVRNLFGDAFELSELLQEKTARHPFRENGIDLVEQSTWLLKRR